MALNDKKGKKRPLLDGLALDQSVQDVKSAIENQTIELSSGGTTLKAPTSVTAIAGTIGAGTVNNAKYHDGSYLQGNEVSGQGLTLEFVYEIPTGKAIDALQFHGRYEGGGTHFMAFQLFDYTLNSWVSITDEENRVPNGTTDALRNIPINNPNFVSGTEAKVRIFHNVTTYFNTHRLYVDYIALQYQTSLDVAIDTTGLATEATLTEVKEAIINQPIDTSILATEGTLAAMNGYVEGLDINVTEILNKVATEAKQDDLIVAVSAISGTAPYKLVKMAYDVDGNLEYKGSNTDEEALDADTDWSIIKYIYTDGNLSSKITKTGSWTGRVALFS